MTDKLQNETVPTNPTTAPAAPFLVKKIGNMTYRVHIYFSETSNETMADKLRRMIKNECVGAKSV